jgi:hypothetical protein
MVGLNHHFNIYYGSGPHKPLRFFNEQRKRKQEARPSNEAGLAGNNEVV